MKKTIQNKNTISFSKIKYWSWKHVYAFLFCTSMIVVIACSSKIARKPIIENKNENRSILQYRFPGFNYSKKYIPIEFSTKYSVQNQVNKIIPINGKFLLQYSNSLETISSPKRESKKIDFTKTIINTIANDTYILAIFNDEIKLFNSNTLELLWEKSMQIDEFKFALFNKTLSAIFLITKNNTINENQIFVIATNNTQTAHAGTILAGKTTKRNIQLAELNTLSDRLLLTFSLGEISEFEIKTQNNKTEISEYKRYKIDGEISSISLNEEENIALLINQLQSQKIVTFKSGKFENKKELKLSNIANEIWLLNDSVFIRGNSAKGQYFAFFDNKLEIKFEKSEKIFASDLNKCKRSKTILLCLYENPDESLQKFLIGFSNTGNMIFNLNYKKTINDFSISQDEKFIVILNGKDLEIFSMF